MENQMDKNMEHDMEARVIQGGVLGGCGKV